MKLITLYRRKSLEMYKEAKEYRILAERLALMLFHARLDLSDGTDISCSGCHASCVCPYYSWDVAECTDKSCMYYLAKFLELKAPMLRYAHETGVYDDTDIV